MEREKDPEPMLGALLRVSFQAVSARILADLHAAGFTDLRLSHLVVFQHLAFAGSRVTDLSERAEITKQSMSALVDHLVVGGYLERSVDPEDGRAKIIRRTERGMLLEQNARASIVALKEEWASALGAERLAECLAFLLDLAELLDRQSASNH